MITILVGKRTPEFEKKRNTILAPFQKTNSIEKRETRELVSTFDEIQTASLFGDKKLFILNEVLDDEESQKVFLEKAEGLANAPHDILITTEKLLATETKKLQPFAEIITITEKISKMPSFDPFALASAFASGDKKNTWIMFQQVAHASDEMEPTHGMMWWKLKDIMIKKNSSFNQDQLHDMARNLVSVYHESRLGGLGMRERLEEFFLTMKK